MSISILLAEDHLIVREGLRTLLKLESEFRLVGEASNGHEAVTLAIKHSPDVIIMDIAMPLLNGLEATRQILHALPSTRILVLSAYSDAAYVEQVMALGAAGYLIKQTATQVLHEAIRAVHSGRTYFSPSISKHRNQFAAKARARGDLPGKTASKLTPREAEVLQLVAEGKANKETADVLNFSVKTVEKHRQSLMEKLNIHDTAGLTRHAIAVGIIESSVQVTYV